MVNYFSSKAFIKRFLVQISIVLVLINVLMYKVESEYENKTIYSYIANKQDLLYHEDEYLHAIISGSIYNVMFLGKQRSVREFLIDSSKTKNLIEDMVLLATNQRSYKQIRFLDADGMEKIRINWDHDSLILVHDSLLQDKSHRDYFQKTKVLKQGEIYFSPINLNVEHRKIEIPFNIVTRISTPIRDINDSLLGVIIINQYLNEYFEKNKSKLNSDDEFMFLNRNSYWIYSENYKTFGFEFDSLKNERFDIYYPKVWHAIINDEKVMGSVILDSEIFVFRKATLSNNIINKRDTASAASIFSHMYYLVYKIDLKKTPLLNYQIKYFYLFAIFINIVVAFGIFLIHKSTYDRLMHLEELDAANKNLEKKIADRTKMLSDKNEELNVLNKELEAFTYSVSHDLRAPLRHIAGYVSLLEKKHFNEMSEGAKRYFSIIKEAGEGMGILIENLLRFSRIGRVKMTFTTINHNNIINNVQNEISSDFSGHTIHFEIPELPKTKGDEILIRQVWFNILHNAVKYSTKEREIVVKVAYVQDDDMCTFSVTDNGVGFDMAYKNKLFDTFQRLHNNDEFEGVGVGLSFVQRIIIRHGGQVWADSKVNEGATFYFTLPNADV